MKKDQSFSDAMRIVEAQARARPSTYAPFDVCVEDLRPGYQAAVRHEIERGALDHGTIDGKVWVSKADLFELAGPGADMSDPEGGCYIAA